ncbi:hypothetical protein VUR80DRAFT_8754 [Thermomyces stellatus]
MPPIPIFTKSPVNAAKADGATPKTDEDPNASSAPNGREATTTVPPPLTGTSTYPAPQPGARPPGPTEALNLAPTTTHTTTVYGRYASATVTSSAVTGNGMTPPGPQPGAAPTPPSRTNLPPPPKAGESKASDPSKPTTAKPEPRPTVMPPQMAIPPPTGAPTGSGTSAIPVPTGPRPTTLFEADAGSPSVSIPLSYPQGAQQTQGFIPAGSAGYHPSPSRGQAEGGLSGAEGEDDSLWGAAKKWAQAAGGSIAAAEDEVWRRINKS